MRDTTFPVFCFPCPNLLENDCAEGMLLELPGAVISQMLQDEALLNKALERALTALHPDSR